MKMPNFRLSETQANVAVLVGIVGLVSVCVLAFVTLKNFNRETWTILYSGTSSWGRYRGMMVYLCSAIAVLLGCIALALGFNSLGQKRNPRQGRSFLGMAIGAVIVAIAPVFLTMWIWRAEEIIQKMQ